MSSEAAKCGNSSTKRKRDPEEKQRILQERMIRNRASAQESRAKKQKYIEELEAQNAFLIQSHLLLMEKLQTLESENIQLKKRLHNMEESTLLLSETLAAQSETSSSTLCSHQRSENSSEHSGIRDSAWIRRRISSLLSMK